MYITRKPTFGGAVRNMRPLNVTVKWTPFFKVNEQISPITCEQKNKIKDLNQSLFQTLSIIIMLRFALRRNAVLRWDGCYVVLFRHIFMRPMLLLIPIAVSVCRVVYGV